MKHSYLTVIILILLGTFSSKAQQDPQYTQYMYNTQVVNPAYAGNRETLNFGLLYRTQWVGFEGAPKTGTFTVSSPVGIFDNMGLGLSIVRDEIGPSIETNVNVDYSYSIQTSQTAKLSFGLKAGVDLLDVDFNKLNLPNYPAGEDPFFENNNIDNKLQPQIGAGVYYNTEKFYAGLSVPNFLTTKHFDRGSLANTQLETTPAERMHYFLIAGYVFDISDNLKFKPATLFKMVSGSPLQADVSANFLLYDKLTLGAAYRWSAAFSGLVGFQFTDEIFLGFGYDYQTTDIEDYSDGSYEFMLRFELFNRPERVLTPRFF
ncbi:PorP/SprF family type IX secretion system membrane protein [Aequorivita echinoideorum]|uniref:Type IX secretion system membrane protein PorP/SprF n=1 Tax=Aequorivita echinoideorum TaxID=1549647 RepID=A0ABS5S8Y8_9FLAO|nr:type IX secretion system membrane protein PorP/SprF [Aequorivita echinoideorum]MBT0608350.1 type IX secretion system membrane protein PorP/SprF [Aequorivita echinoideorum]